MGEENHCSGKNLVDETIFCLLCDTEILVWVHGFTIGRKKVAERWQPEFLVLKVVYMVLRRALVCSDQSTVLWESIKLELETKFKIRRKVLTLKCNYNSLKICGALWDNYAYLLSN